MTELEFRSVVATSFRNELEYVVQISEASDLTYRLPYKNGEKNPKLRYAIKVYAKLDFFVVWSVEYHRKHRGEHVAQTTYSLPHNTNITQYNSQSFAPIYHSLGKRNSQCKEKIYIVGLDNVHTFFSDLDLYMRHNEFDEEYPPSLPKTNDWLTAKEREKNSSMRKKRDFRFRDLVLSAYDYKCAICRCDTYEVLEAAHEYGYEVAHTNYDDPEHGVCLCANHHILYDRKLIKLDLIKGKICSVDNSLSKTMWYHEVVEKYSCKLAPKKVTIKECR